MKRLAWILSVAGILVIVLLALLRDEPAPQPARPAESAPSAATVIVESPTTIANEREAIVSGADLESSKPESLSRLVVCVVGDANGAALAGARVTLCDFAELSIALESNDTTLDTPAGRRIRRELELASTAAADGCAEFARSPKRAMIAAQSGERWGFAVLGVMPVDHRLTVRVTTEVSVRVRVVAADGKPLSGVPIALRRPANTRPRFEWRATESEAPDGIATFEHY